MAPDAKPTCVVVTTRAPWPEIGGERLRLGQMIRGLQRKFRVKLVVLNDPFRTLEFSTRPPYLSDYSVIDLAGKSILAGLLSALVSRLPFQTAMFSSRKALGDVERAIGGHELVIFHLIRLGEHALRHCDERQVAIDFTDAISDNYAAFAGLSGVPAWKRVLFKIEAARLRNYEARVSRQVGASFVVSDRDQQSFIENAGRPPHVVGNQVATADLPYAQRDPARTLCVIANFASEQNQDGLDDFLSSTLPLLPAAWRVQVIGNASRNYLLALRKHGQVYATGRVDSVASAATGSFIGLCPVRAAAGMQNKIYEYGALGLPVVTSVPGANGIPRQLRRFLNVYRSAEECCALLENIVARPEPALRLAFEFRLALEQMGVASAGKNTFEDIMMTLKNASAPQRVQPPSLTIPEQA